MGSDSHAELESDSIYLIRDAIRDRAELRRLRRLPAIGMRGANDITDDDREELFCPGGIQLSLPSGFVTVWELRRWDPDANSDPDSAERLDSWRHLLDAGFRVGGIDEVLRMMKDSKS